ncbi:hypothetical protein J6590_031241 [Homalodisca vitripennis]|nr:hypothetical protein J6590_031241 [Homalodisca vitripennis]
MGDDLIMLYKYVSCWTESFPIHLQRSTTLQLGQGGSMCVGVGLDRRPRPYCTPLTDPETEMSPCAVQAELLAAVRSG